MDESTHNDGVHLPLAELINTRHVSAGYASTQRVGLGPWMGPFRGLKRGHGLDFDDLRPYTDGDDVRHIDWKVTARYNTPYTRLYREEKDNVITFAVDFRSSMFTGSSELRAVQAGRVTSALLWQAIQSGSRCAVVVLNDQGTQAIPSVGGERGALAACVFLAEQFKLAKRRIDQSQGSTESEHPNMLGQTMAQPNQNELVNWLLRQGRLVGNIVLVSGFDQIESEWMNSLSILTTGATQYRQLCVVHIVDPMEVHGIPAGSYTYKCLGKIHSLRLNRAQSKTLKNQLDQKREAIEQSFKQLGIFRADTSRGFDECVSCALGVGWLA